MTTTTPKDPTACASMVTTTARVTTVAGAVATVVCESKPRSCSRCNKSGGCASAQLSQMFSKPIQLDITHQGNIQVGQIVHIGLTGQRLTHIALLLYGLPLLFCFAGTFLGALWYPSQESVSILLSASGLGGGIFLTRLLTSHMTLQAYQPILMKQP